MAESPMAESPDVASSNSELSGLESPSRRRFLRRAGWTVAGLTVTSLVAYPTVRAHLPALPSLAGPKPDDGFAWVQMLADGRVRFYCPRMEMGQGASLGLAQIVAEELNVAQAQIECVLPDTTRIGKVKMTVGSESIFLFARPVARTAAALREVLRERAAQKFSVPLSTVSDEVSGFAAADGRTVTYDELVPGEPLLVDADEAPDAVLYFETRHGEAAQQVSAQQSNGQNAGETRAFRAVGKSWKHHELEAIVTGEAVYSTDVTVPDMLFGRVAHPPTLRAAIVSVDASVTERMPGVRAVVTDLANAFVGVVTDDPFQLDAAFAALKIQWKASTEPELADPVSAFDVNVWRARDHFEHTIVDDGDISIVDSASLEGVAARYETPFLSHSPMEPRASVAWVRDDGVQVWCGTQDAFFVRARVAKTLDLAPEQVVVHPQRMGGGFGGRIQCQASEEAARLSAAVKQPVRVQWNRTDELAQSAFLPAYSHYIDIRVDAEGRFKRWEHDIVTSPILLGALPQLLGDSGFAGSAIGLADRFIPDKGSVRGAVPEYAVAHQRIRYQPVRARVPTSAWRGLGAGPNAFAIECAIDEAAAVAGWDPLELRLKNLPASAARLAATLKEAARVSDWGRTLPQAHGLGIAAAVYKEQTSVAVVAQVEIDHDAKRIRVPKIWCAHDCGLIINPDQVLNLIEGNVVWGCGMALEEHIHIRDGEVVQRNFDTYQVLRQTESPDVVVSLIEPPGAEPVGVGESALPPVAPAIANAVYAATGKRLRKLPMSYQDLAAT